MRTKKTMKLMSWNVGKPSKETLLAYCPRIKDENIDILALQEVTSDSIDHIKDGLSKIGLNYVKTSCDLDVNLDKTGPRENGKVKDGVLIASRWPLELIPKFFEKIPWQKSALSTIVTTPYGEIELHTVHVPNASSNSRKIKVETFNSIYHALAKPSQRHRLLCGDFNSPKKESSEGNTYWGTISEHQRSEDRVIKGLKEHDLEDTYRKLHTDYNDGEYSHVNSNPKTPNRRYDHIFSSSSLNPIECEYLHEFRESGLSDHSPVYAVYEPKHQRRPRKKNPVAGRISGV